MRQNAFQSLLSQNKRVLEGSRGSTPSQGQTSNAFIRTKYPQAPRPNPPAERNPLKRTRGDKFRTMLGLALGGNPELAQRAQGQRDLERFSEVFAQDPRGAIQMAQQAGRADLAEYGMKQLEVQKQSANAQVQADQRQATYELLQASNPLMAAAYQANPEKFGESLSTNYEAGTVGAGETFVRDAGGLANVSVSPERPDLPAGYTYTEDGQIAEIPGYFDNKRSVASAGRSSTNVYTGNVGQGDRPIVDKPPKGFQRVFDPASNTYRDIPIPGSESDLDRQKEQVAAQTKFEAGNAQFNTMINSIDKALGQISATSAGLGSLTAGIPSTNARDLQATLETVQALVGFDALQRMRDSSPTGGALGQVTEKELRFLQSVQGSLDQGQSPEQLSSTLAEVKASLERLNAARQQDFQQGQQRFQQFSTQTGRPVEEMSLDEINAEIAALGGQP